MSHLKYYFYTSVISITMYQKKQEQKFNMPNLLLIAGNGRNQGKTYLACKIIQHLSESKNVTGLKISPHFHDYPLEDLLCKSDKFIILKESKINKKDSSLMWQAGANQVYFIMTKQVHIADAFAYLHKYIQQDIIICESGGLIEVVKPGIFLFVTRKDNPIQKKHLLDFDPYIINNGGVEIDFDCNTIAFQNNRFAIQQ